MRNCIANGVIVNRIEHFLGDVDHTVATIPVHIAVHGGSVAGTTLFFACGSFSVVIEPPSRKRRLAHSRIEDTERRAHDRLPFRRRHAHSTVCLNRIEFTDPLNGIDPIQSWTKSCLAICLSTFVPHRLLSTFCKTLSGHVFATFKEIEELGLRHNH